MKKIYFADIETSMFQIKTRVLTKKLSKLEKLQLRENNKLEFKLGCCIRYNDNSEIIEKFDTNNQIDFCNFFIKKANFKNKTIVYFHNLKFDIKFLIDILRKEFEIIDFITAGNKTISVQCKKLIIKKNKNGSTRKVNAVGLEFRDSLSILLASIKELGKMIELPKLDVNFSKTSIEYLTIYCYRDCEVIYHSLNNLCNSLNDIFSKFNLNIKINKLKLTIASLSKYIFSLMYSDVFFKADKRIEKYFRKYYFGGRVEVFDFNLIKNVNYNDINSLYPFILTNFDFSDKTIRFIDISKKNIELEKILLLQNLIGIECIISENQEIPIYPLRVKGKVLFCNGVKKCFISKYEIEKLIEINVIPEKIQILKINKIVFTIQILNFKDFFENLYNLRKKTTGFMNYLIKILMNSLYGKFAQKIIRDKKEIISNLNNINLIEHKVVQINGFFYLTSQIENYKTYINLINGILTTNYARFYLWLFLRNANPVYCDTDSIVSKELKNAKFDNNLGSWKIEFIAHKFQAIDTKEYYYTANNEFKSKLKSFNVKSLENVNQLKSLYKFGMYNHKINSIFQCIREKINFQSETNYVKEKSSIYLKRIINNDLTTNPINICKDNLNLVQENNRKYIKQIIDKL